jgi:iron complex transport system ATP-binding protein
MMLAADRLSYTYCPGPASAFARSATADKKAGHYENNVTSPADAGRRHGEFALRDVSVNVAPGSLTGLLGPNGCGKTTLLKLLSGVLKPDVGSVRLGGRELRQLTARAIAQQIAVVPQETHPAFDFTVLEMVLMGRHPHLSAFQLEGPGDLAIADEAMQATGTAPLANRAYMTLSGGEKQRVVIASALAQKPNVLLLDEPTASLDLGYQLEIASLLKELNAERGVTMVLATHDLNLAASVCDTLVLVREGRVLTQGATRDVLTSDAVQQLYGVIADVSFHEGAGHVTVIPVRRQ